ncbi:hypothetical protein [Bdellovibrio sp. HCB337]|uniref:COG4315 family predicted lipoprotein n=1 Tax=Bdellovibrio sp. HCB337 TaxID=3394358 RepID=UPI0039A6262A
MKKLVTTITAIILVGSSALALGPVTFQKHINDDKSTRLVLADSQGLSLYTFTPDKEGESTCYDACAQTWPPVLITEEISTQLTGILGSTKRRDGSLQLTVDSRPVYLFAADRAAGDINGEGLGDVWFVIDFNVKR